jgi:hypothetical protein
MPAAVYNNGATVRLSVESFCRVRSLISPGGQLMGLGWRTLGRCARIFNELEPKFIRRTKTGHFLLFPYIQNQDCISAVRRWGGRLCYVCQGSRPHVYGGIFLIWPPPVSKRVLFYFLFPPKITQGCAFCESALCTSVSAAPLPYNKTDRKAFFRAAAGEEISYLGGCEREKKDGVSLSVSIMGHVAVRRCCSCHCYQK